MSGLEQFYMGVTEDKPVTAVEEMQTAFVKVIGDLGKMADELEALKRRVRALEASRVRTFGHSAGWMGRG